MSDASGTTHAELLAKVELFARLDRVTLARLAAYLEPVTLEDGASVCRQGDPGDALYIVTRGRFGVFASSPDGAGETRLGANVLGLPGPTQRHNPSEPGNPLPTDVNALH